MPEPTDPEMGFGLDHPDQGDVEHNDPDLTGDPIGDDVDDVPDLEPDTSTPEADPTP